VKVCVDAAYGEGCTAAAGVVFREWSDEQPEQVMSTCCMPAGPYVPGRFYERELPCVLQLLRQLSDIAVVVIDGYVWLGRDRPGLGWHVHRCLGGVPVIGVAKKHFRGSEEVAVSVFRGRSRRPLMVTAVGTEVRRAAEAIAGMAGGGRIPLMMRLADRAARQRVLNHLTAAGGVSQSYSDPDGGFGGKTEVAPRGLTAGAAENKDGSGGFGT